MESLNKANRGSITTGYDGDNSVRYETWDVYQMLSI